MFPGSGLHRKVSKRVLSISREGGYANSLDSLFQYSVTLKLKRFPPPTPWELLCWSRSVGFSLCQAVFFRISIERASWTLRFLYKKTRYPWQWFAIRVMNRDVMVEGHVSPGTTSPRTDMTCLALVDLGPCISIEAVALVPPCLQGLGWYQSSC